MSYQTAGLRYEEDLKDLRGSNQFYASWRSFVIFLLSDIEV